MSHHRRRLRRAALRRRALLDSLEPRCLLATGLPGISAVSFDTATNPPQVEILFNPKDVAQIDSILAPQTGLTGETNFWALLNVLDQANGFEIDQVGRDGTVISQILGPDNPPPIEYVSDVVVHGSQAVRVAIPLFGAALQPANYQVCIEGSTNLDQMFDAVEPGPAWDALWNSFQPMVIGQFAVYGTGASFVNASSLPALGSGVLTFTGSLNPDDYRSAVDLYQFTLGPTPTNLWQFGVSVQAHSIGSPLQADVTLFRSDGTVVASGLSGTGLPGDPGDPYLFAGLAPGTYYVGVSGAGYLPYGSSGYDPTLGIPGALGLHQPGGPFPFQVSLVAVPHGKPTILTDAKPSWLDPLSSSPTSLTLDFSGPIDLSNLFVVDQAQSALELVDSANSVWPITAESYDTSAHQLIMIIDEPLPGGTYRLVTPAAALSDLAGQPVVAPGEPAGVLATFNVASPSGASIPGNLGVLWPEQIAVSPSSIGDTLGGSVDLAPGQSVTYRFVAIVPGLYKLQTVVDSGSILVQQFGSAGMNTLDAGSTHWINNYYSKLADGVYQIGFTNVSAHPAAFQWQLTIASVDWEKLIANGVGQSGALVLSLMSPPSADPNPSPAPSLQGPLTLPLANVTYGAIGPIPSNLLITQGSSLLGQPESTASALASVGPSADNESVALADRGNGLFPGIRYVSMYPSDASGDSGAVAEVGPIGRSDEPGVQLTGHRTAPTGSLPDGETSSILADKRALGEPEWMIRMAGVIRNWFGPKAPESPIPPTNLDPAHSPTTVYAGLGSETFAVGPLQQRRIVGTPARADIEFPTGLIVIAVAAYRLQDPIRRWWRRRALAQAKVQQTTAPVYPPPHSSSNSERARTRVRK